MDIVSRKWLYEGWSLSLGSRRGKAGIRRNRRSHHLSVPCTAPDGRSSQCERRLAQQGQANCQRNVMPRWLILRMLSLCYCCRRLLRRHWPCYAQRRRCGWRIGSQMQRERRQQRWRCSQHRRGCEDLQQIGEQDQQHQKARARHHLERQCSERTWTHERRASKGRAPGPRWHHPPLHCKKIL